jgi:hypothetical protein
LWPERRASIADYSRPNCQRDSSVNAGIYASDGTGTLRKWKAIPPLFIRFVLAPAVQKAIHEIDIRLPVFDVRSMRESTQMASSFAVIQSTLAGMFALIGLVLAITGIYGVVAYRTQMRTTRSECEWR